MYFVPMHIREPSPWGMMPLGAAAPQEMLLLDPVSGGFVARERRPTQRSANAGRRTGPPPATAAGWPAYAYAAYPAAYGGYSNSDGYDNDDEDTGDEDERGGSAAAHADVPFAYLHHPAARLLPRAARQQQELRRQQLQQQELRQQQELQRRQQELQRRQEELQQHYMQQQRQQQQQQQQRRQPVGRPRTADWQGRVAVPIDVVMQQGQWHPQRQPMASALRAAQKQSQQEQKQQHEEQQHQQRQQNQQQEQQLRTPEQQQDQRERQQRYSPAKPPAAATMARTASSLIRTRTEAATTIQAAWRGWRLARHRRVMQALAAAARALAEARQQFETATAENALGASVPGSSGSSAGRGDGQPAAAAGVAAAAALSHQQYLLCQELATRPLLDLDAVSCSGVPELRALRKRLVTEAIGLLDEIQCAYKAAVTASLSTARGGGSNGRRGGNKRIAGGCSEERVRVRLVLPHATREVAVQTD